LEGDIRFDNFNSRISTYELGYTLFIYLKYEQINVEVDRYYLSINFIYKGKHIYNLMDISNIYKKFKNKKTIHNEIQNLLKSKPKNVEEFLTIKERIKELRGKL